MMPLPDAPRALHPNHLDAVLPLPDNMRELRITVSLGRADERVHGRVDVQVPDGELLLGTVRCGIRVWRTALLPGLLALAERQQVPCNVREVENGPSHKER